MPYSRARSRRASSSVKAGLGESKTEIWFKATSSAGDAQARTAMRVGGLGENGFLAPWQLPHQPIFWPSKLR